MKLVSCSEPTILVKFCRDNRMSLRPEEWVEGARLRRDGVCRRGGAAQLAAATVER